MRKAIKIKHLGKLSSGVIFQHNYGRSHVARVYVEALVRKKWEVLKHLAHSPDLSFCDYHILDH